MNALGAATDLDDVFALRAADPEGMLGHVYDFPEQFDRGCQLGRELKLPSSYAQAKHVVVCGLGGSAIGGDLLRAIFQREACVPISVCRDYHLPGYAGIDTIVLLCSYSGSTEETLSCAEEAQKRDCKIVCVTSGGGLAELAERRHFPMVKVPGGQPPRTATGYMFAPLMYVLHQARFVQLREAEIAQTAHALRKDRERVKPATSREGNPAKQLAGSLHRTIPVFCGAASWAQVLAYRFKCQVNENAKAHAFASAYPELNHNEILGWERAGDQASNFLMVNLRDAAEDRKTEIRLRVTRQVVEERGEGGFPVVDLVAEGACELEKAMRMMFLGDFASVYLAFLYGVDPYVIPAINLLKQELGKVGS